MMAYEVYIKKFPDNYKERIYCFNKKYSTLEEALKRARTYIKNKGLKETDFVESKYKNGIEAHLDHGTIRTEDHYITIRSRVAHSMEFHYNKIFE